jgi:C4-dicarboxylate-specific signal transduction histidine kinase
MMRKLLLLAEDLEAFARRTRTVVETGGLADIQSLVANVSRVVDRMAREVADLNNFADEITRDAKAGPKEEQHG